MTEHRVSLKSLLNVRALQMSKCLSYMVFCSYMAPEYASSGKLTEKSDVFSYGVVLLEIITGRRPVDESRPIGDESLVEWVSCDTDY